MSIFLEQVFSEASIDKFFGPNICHVCKKPWERDDNYITCDLCHMIYYCSKNHKSKNKKRHVQICKALQNVSQSHPQLWSTYGINLEEWIQTRKQLMRLVKLDLQRVLEPYEMQMITLAKSCIICYRQTNLLHCHKCFSINYCRDHKKLLGNRHRFYCKKLKECLWINMTLSVLTVATDRFSEFPDENKYNVNCMKAFMDQFVCPKYHTDDTNFIGDKIMCLHYSDYVSGPLTLHYGIQKINTLDFFDKSDSYFVIHIIEANFVDRKYILAWELLLHLLPNIKELKIILIGPELHIENGDLMLCTFKCVERQLNFEVYHMLYHEYVDSEFYKQPNLIIGFQADLSNWEALSEMILKIKDQECPFLLTSKSKYKAEQNVNKIKQILKSPICNILYLVYNGKNKFSSTKPYDDFENRAVSYRNMYLTVYKKL